MKDIKISNSALIVVDMQNDFLPGGSLAIPNADTIIPVINEYIRFFETQGLPVVYTRDWHPEDHLSFKENGGQWPRHCVQNTPGSEFHHNLYFPKNYIIISKAYEPQLEAYSGFQSTDLDQKLKDMNIENLFVCGVATDYCVFHTVMDAIRLGYKVYLLVDAIRGVDLNPNDSEEAIKKMINAGVELIVFEELFQAV
ncbi:MAG: bifunctional nicotinamidase/pyrazinamidase [Candidatus Calescibacterium sp.]|nr:bifunctional nicotinamidase/pyrazinamidase [Candidatus Calescibacterium sp.]MCX7972161.1 bifunctional nicotinamidase/pyrazinamidase [bacterium]MDW8194850.1 bifunctional nicotinamidase/pyrazinamidase [Candidatus Calescibacterium sp.]